MKEEPGALEEQFYDPSLPRRFRYEPRPELLEAALSGQDGEEREVKASASPKTPFPPPWWRSRGPTEERGTWSC